MSLLGQLLAAGLFSALISGFVAVLVARSQKAAQEAAAQATVDVAATAAAATLQTKQEEIAAGAWARAEAVYRGGLEEAGRQIAALRNRVSDQDAHITDQDDQLVACRRRISSLEEDLAEERRQRRLVERDLRVAKQALALVHIDEDLPEHLPGDLLGEDPAPEPPDEDADL